MKITINSETYANVWHIEIMDGYIRIDSHDLTGSMDDALAYVHAHPEINNPHVTASVEGFCTWSEAEIEAADWYYSNVL